MTAVAIERRLEQRFPRLGQPLPKPTVSIELFPPKSGPATDSFFAEVERLVAIEPAYFSVTSGAGGGAQAEATFQTIAEVRRRFGIDAAPHVTAVALSRGELDELAHRYVAAGVDKVVALRGDPPNGVGKAYEPRPDGYAYAADLVAALRRIHDFDIAVGGYPEIHPAASDGQTDLRHLQAKVDAGASRIITQYCFDTDAILRFRDACDGLGIAAKIVPGVMPVHNFAQLSRFSGLCGASIPAWLGELFAGLEPQQDTARMVATTVATEQCRHLVAEGFDELHLYALNRADLTLAICRMLGFAGATCPSLATAA